MFDKAVKERNKEWKGYANYDWTDNYDENTKKGNKILEKIDNLDLSNNALLRLPKEIAECPNLKHINLLGNNNIDWQDCFEKVKNIGITSVYVSVYYLDSIPEKYWKLITGIKLINYRVVYIPENILQQKQLTYLDISGEYNHKKMFFSLPTELFELTNLQYLNLADCNIDIFPNQIKNLTNLTELDLGGNKLTNLPPEIGNLSNLIKLNLRYNKLSSLPLEIGNLNSLTELDIRFNQLSSLPPEIGNLSNLTILDLSENQLSSLPPEIGNLSNLTWLYLTSNQLSSLPPEIGNLSNLTELDLEENQLSSLPPEIGNLSNLTWIYLNSNQLSSLPAEIGNLSNLTGLDLEENQLSSLPPEIGNLSNLTGLYLTENQLSSLPLEIGNLSNLTELYLKGNPISSEHIEEIKIWLPNCKIIFKPYHEYWWDKSEKIVKLKYKKITTYYLTQINDTTGLSPNNKEIYANSFNKEGVKFDKNNQKDSAFIYYKKSAEIKPDFYEGWHNMGYIFSNYKKNPDSAIICYKKAIEIDSTKASAWSNLAGVYISKNVEKYDLAIDCYLKYIAIDSTKAYIWRNMAFCYLYCEKFEDAEKVAKKSLLLDNSDKNLYSNLSLARAYLFQGKYDDSKDIYLKYKEVEFPGDETGSEASLRQLKAMEEYGIYHPDVEKIRKLLKE